MGILSEKLIDILSTSGTDVSLIRPYDLCQPNYDALCTSCTDDNLAPPQISCNQAHSSLGLNQNHANRLNQHQHEPDRIKLEGWSKRMKAKARMVRQAHCLEKRKMRWKRKQVAVHVRIDWHWLHWLLHLCVIITTSLKWAMQRLAWGLNAGEEEADGVEGWKEDEWMQGHVLACGMNTWTLSQTKKKSFA